MIECIHNPEVQAGKSCNCLECRTERANAYKNIIGQCALCAGTYKTDHSGQFTCAKANYDCPVLDLWHCVINREIEPDTVTNAMVELVFQGKIEAPVKYSRIPGTDNWKIDAIRDMDKESEPVIVKKSVKFKK